MERTAISGVVPGSSEGSGHNVIGWGDQERWNKEEDVQTSLIAQNDSTVRQDGGT